CFVCQGEDGIGDWSVTGVQTCALPIFGLSLVRGLVEMHGGTAVARSGGPGAGAEFVVKLPIAVALTVPEPPLAEVQKPCGVGCKIGRASGRGRGRVGGDGRGGCDMVRA